MVRDHQPSYGDIVYVLRASEQIETPHFVKLIGKTTSCWFRMDDKGLVIVRSHDKFLQWSGKINGNVVRWDEKPPNEIRALVTSQVQVLAQDIGAPTVIEPNGDQNPNFVKLVMGEEFCWVHVDDNLVVARDAGQSRQWTGCIVDGEVNWDGEVPKQIRLLVGRHVRFNEEKSKLQWDSSFTPVDNGYMKCYMKLDGDEIKVRDRGQAKEWRGKVTCAFGVAWSFFGGAPTQHIQKLVRNWLVVAREEKKFDLNCYSVANNPVNAKPMRFEGTACRRAQPDNDTPCYPGWVKQFLEGELIGATDTHIIVLGPDNRPWKMLHVDAVMKR